MTEEIVAPVQTEETVRAEMPEIIDFTPTESAGKKENSTASSCFAFSQPFTL